MPAIRRAFTRLYALACATALVLATSAVATARSPRGATKPVARATGPAITFTGFDEHDDGTSRLYVKLTEPVTVQPRFSGKHLEFFFPGTTIPLRNNKNPLITSHFGSQVVSARLGTSGEAKRKRGRKGRARNEEPEGARLFVETREAVKPDHRLISNNDGTATLVIDFRKPSKPPPPEPDETPLHPKASPSAS